MQLHELTNSLPLHDRPLPIEARNHAEHGAGGFTGSLAAALRLDRTDEQDARRQQVRQAAEQFVASAFLTPIFKQMRDSPFKSEFLSGGAMEDAFGAQLDEHLADRMVSRMHMPLVDTIERMFMGQGRTTGTRLNTHG